MQPFTVIIAHTWDDRVMAYKTIHTNAPSGPLAAIRAVGENQLEGMETKAIAVFRSHLQAIPLPADL